MTTLINGHTAFGAFKERRYTVRLGEREAAISKYLLFAKRWRLSENVRLAPILRHLSWATLLAASTVFAAAGPDPLPVWTLHSRIVAIGLHQAYGIRQVGRFHSGGPLTSNPEFLLQTQAGRALDPARILVAVNQNFGAGPVDPAQAPGAILSIDPSAATDGKPLVVPADLGSRPPSAGASVLLYSAQSERYANRVHNGGARTANAAGVSGPRYISVNNAFGRPWIANAPYGLRGAGSESVLDPDGAPLANAPSDSAGGVFLGTVTARTSTPKAVRVGFFASILNQQSSGQLTPGSIDGAALGTALLGSSPDGSGFAVFAVVTGSGAVVQVHVQDGVDGLAPAGTVDIGDQDPGVVGIAFKWNPDRVLYLADARRDAIAVLHLSDDSRHFTVVSATRISSPMLKHPVDLAACVPEIANARFASHTTLAGGSDLYVVNRGDGSVIRMRQDGTVVARAAVHGPDGQPLGPDRLRSIAVSADAQRIWLIVEQAGSGESALIETTGFDAGGTFGKVGTQTIEARTRHADTAADGARFFSTPFTARAGLGPLFNADSCIACHPGPGGASPSEEHFARRIARMEPSSGRLLPIDGQPSAVAARHSVNATGSLPFSSVGLPRFANVVSLRMPLSLFAAGHIDDIPDAVIEAQAVSKGDGIKGRVHHVKAADGTQRVGRYGWKADIATLDEMVAEALGNEMGITSAASTHPQSTVKDDGSIARSLSLFVKDLHPASTSPRAVPSLHTGAAEAGR
ncbi:MAG: di-heme oxidoredictase family protein [Rhodoferax sp.]|uniref:di-heme oxidoredictase family protein n=1 Tax=Rhodoferax sp. TaxID=50421 RepID=UPI0032634259